MCSGQKDVYDDLWDNAVEMDIPTKTSKTPFMQHMKSGNLQSDDYVTFMIQYTKYLVEVTALLKTMSQKVKSPMDQSNFFYDRYQSYKTLTESTLKQFNLKDVEEIEPIPAMEKYLKNYRTIMENQDPIFFAVSLLPHARLWFWLAKQLDISYDNAYFIWKKKNQYKDPEEHYKELLDKYLNTTDKVNLAKTIFRQQMQNELDFFTASLKA